MRDDILDETDPNDKYWHGPEGTVVDVTVDDAGEDTGDGRDSIDYLVETVDGESVHFRWRDLRPSLEDNER